MIDPTFNIITMFTTQKSIRKNIYGLWSGNSVSLQIIQHISKLFCIWNSWYL